MVLCMIERDKERQTTTITLLEQTDPLEVRITSNGMEVAEWAVDKTGIHQL